MRVGVPKEIKVHEYRVGLVPASVAELTAAGHQVIVETKAGTGIDFSDQDYVNVGATIAADAAEVFAQSDMIVKVKEPQAQEIARLEPRHLLFTYLHLAPDPDQTHGLMKSGATCIAYETVTSDSGALPLLKPMSEVAGRMSIQVASHYLEKEQGGRGELLGGVPGVAPCKVAILGGGVSGINAAQMERFIKKITDTLWVLKDKKIGVLGLAFKQNTDDVRLSPAIDLCQRLLKEGAILRVHDPKAMEKAKDVLKNATYVDDMNAVAEGCDALVVATEWPVFKKLDLERARKSLTHPILFDGRNLFDPAEMEAMGFIYKSVGR